MISAQIFSNCFILRVKVAADPKPILGTLAVGENSQTPHTVVTGAQD